ncbi:hypothetical protein LshimejAT787_0405910 [Lyophyllum shimeji]|uniref:Uncharacterized protein n=1 Tax=Lyophyllum shimeji TaxID=47721 RepID=A0A9P3UN78_LYOSH|nr:hypothetical protein LshimejAT787_0405910 [Lyophyllum shimeji]
MIQFMTGEGYSEDDLKPAFILLSGCETDLAKRAKASQSSDAEEHYQKSQAWLQKVYGKFEQEIIPKGKTSETLSIPWHRRAQYSPGSRAHDGILLSPEYSAEESAREIRLERRLQALLDERKEQAVILAETRAAKRKLEEGFMFECDRRRRLLREYDGLQKELATARKMEDYALSQVKREVETRRKAEEIARAERSMRLEIQALFEQTAAPPFTEIANTMRMDDGPPAATFKATNAS